MSKLQIDVTRRDDLSPASETGCFSNQESCHVCVEFYRRFRRYSVAVDRK